MQSVTREDIEEGNVDIIICLLTPQTRIIIDLRDLKHFHESNILLFWQNSLYIFLT